MGNTSSEVQKNKKLKPKSKNTKKSNVSGIKNQKNLTQKDVRNRKNEKGKKKTKQVKNKKKMDKKNEIIADSWEKGKKEFAEYVTDALRANFDLTTLSDIETYISTRYRSTVDAFNRRKIITKVIADEFLKGCIAVRTTKGR